MHTIAKSLVNVAVLALSLAGAPAHADGFTRPFEQPLGWTHCDSITTYNATNKWMWVTIYDLGKTRHLDYGWVGPNSNRGWASGGYSCAGVYYVRAEVKSNESDQPVDGPNIFDTTVQVRGTGHEIWLQTDWINVREPDGRTNLRQRYKSFWWDVNARPSLMDLANNSPTYDAPVVTVVNSSAQPMFVSVSPVGVLNPAADLRCIAPGAQTSYETGDIGPVTFGVAGPFATCATRTNLGTMSLIPWKMDWGTHRVVLRMGLVADGAPVQGVNQYALKNATGSPVKFVVDGAPANQVTCVNPGATSPAYQLPLNLPAGPHKVTSYTVGRCNDANDAGVKLATDEILVMPVFRTNYALRWAFFAN